MRASSSRPLAESHPDAHTNPEPERPLEIPFDPPFSLLLQLSCTNQALFRIHAASSISPLIWTGQARTSGFLSPNVYLASLTPEPYEVYHSLLPGVRGVRFPHPRRAVMRGLQMAPGPYLRHTIVDHILGKARQTCIPQLPTIEEKEEGVWDDERTPWISASANLLWCIWEIARRLAIPPDTPGWVKSVELAVLRHPGMHPPHDPSTGMGKVGPRDDHEDVALLGQEMDEGSPHSSSDSQGGSEPHKHSITQWTEQQQQQRHQPKSKSSTTRDRSKHKKTLYEPRRAPREIWLRPSDHLAPQVYPGEMPLSLKDAYEAARKAALAAGEVLFFGRVWAENVLLNLEWTREDTPLDLPPHFFSSEPAPRLRPAQAHVRARSGSWIDSLVWDPRTDEYLSTLEKVMQARARAEGDRGNGEREMPKGPL